MVGSKPPVAIALSLKPPVVIAKRNGDGRLDDFPTNSDKSLEAKARVHAQGAGRQASLARTPVQGRALWGKSTLIGTSTSPPRCAFAVSARVLLSSSLSRKNLNEQRVEAMLRPPQRRSPRIASHTSALLLSILFALSLLAQPCQSLPEVMGNFSCDHSDTLACAHTLVSLAPLLQSLYFDPRSQRLTLGESHDNLPPVALSPLQHCPPHLNPKP